MNLITADFDWISIVITLVAVIAAFNKPKAKKNGKIPEPTTTDWGTELQEDEMEEPEEYENDDKIEYETLEGRFAVVEEQPQPSFSAELPGDYYRPKESLSEVTADTGEEKNDTELFQWDLRKAVLSSEILKRPEF